MRPDGASASAVIDWSQGERRRIVSSSEQVAKSRETLTPRPIDRGVRIGHVHLKVADLERALHFYCGVPGFELTQRPTGAAFAPAGGLHYHIPRQTRESLCR